MSKLKLLSQQLEKQKSDIKKKACRHHVVLSENEQISRDMTPKFSRFHVAGNDKSRLGDDVMELIDKAGELLPNDLYQQLNKAWKVNDFKGVGDARDVIAARSLACRMQRGDQ